VIGRVIIAPEGRGQKLGHTLIEKALESIEDYWSGQPVFLSAQAHLQPFYEQHGFRAEGEIYLEDEIPHIGMRRG
jgi:ElaA protein